ncbi:hypothetical protein JCM10207_001713 [Rhodosporidiobolus poonsookiae]
MNSALVTARLRSRPTALPSPAAWLPRHSAPPRNIFLHDFSTSALVFTRKKANQWVQRQQQDPFVRARASSASRCTPSSTSSGPTSTTFVARSAFKLLELHDTWHGDTKILRPGMTVVDLGAAPGGWVQAAQEILQGRGLIIGVDLLPLQRGIGDLDGVSFVQGDFLDPVVQGRLRSALGDATGKLKPTVDLVLSDMMANMSGSLLRDAQLSLDLSEAALAFAVQHLSPYSPPSSSPSSTKPVPPVQLIIKHFTSSFTADFRKELQRRFALVKWVKPSSSRGESREGFFVCAGFRPCSMTSNAEQAADGDGSSLYF